MLEVKNLSKRYGEKQALRSVSFSIQGREAVGFLGINGAGKTTTMNILTGYISASDGDVVIDGIDVLTDPLKAKTRIGYLPEQPPVYGDMRVDEYLNFIYQLKKVKKNKAIRQNREEYLQGIMELVGITDVSKRMIRNLSKGYKQRVGLAQALIGDPEILILDEPTAGLDPKERVRFRNVISSLGKNRMVLLSTRIVSDIDYIADRILIMKNGELIQEGTEKEITDKVEGCVWKCIVSEKEAGQITSSFIVSNMRSSGENVELRIVSERQPVVGAENVESTLEDAYLYHTQITGGEKNATL